MTIAAKRYRDSEQNQKKQNIISVTMNVELHIRKKTIKHTTGKYTKKNTNIGVYTVVKCTTEKQWPKECVMIVRK